MPKKEAPEATAKKSRPKENFKETLKVFDIIKNHKDGVTMDAFIDSGISTTDLEIAMRHLKRAQAIRTEVVYKAV
jgi:hypothetical protein